MATLTKTTTFKHLASKGTLGIVLVRLMMFVNDLTLCNDALEEWHKYQDEPHKKRSVGAMRSDNQDEKAASIRMRMRLRWADGGRA